jgi:type VI secretion system secreted protein Hcp
MDKLVIANLFLSSIAKSKAMLNQIYLTLESSRHGSIAGSVLQPGFEDLIEVFSTEHDVSVDSNFSSRRARGRNKHTPLAVTKGIDKASVLLYDSWNTHDRINLFRLEYYKPNEQGTSSLYYTIELENAIITSIKQQLTNPALSPLPTLEIVSFAYQGITWRFEDGNLEASSNAVSRI